MTKSREITEKIYSMMKTDEVETILALYQRVILSTHEEVAFLQTAARVAAAERNFDEMDINIELIDEAFRHLQEWYVEATRLFEIALERCRDTTGS